jgi:hypothetical protein
MSAGAGMADAGRVAVVVIVATVSVLAMACGKRRDVCRRVERPPVTRLHHPERCRPAPRAAKGFTRPAAGVASMPSVTTGPSAEAALSGHLDSWRM